MSPRLLERNLQLVLRLCFLFSPFVYSLPHLSTTSHSHVGYRGNKVALQNIAPGYSVHAIQDHNALAKRHREDGDDQTHDGLDSAGDFAAMPVSRPNFKSQGNSKPSIAKNEPAIHGVMSSGNTTQFHGLPEILDSISPPNRTPSTGSNSNVGDCAHLGQLYTDMNGPSWRHQQGWDASGGSSCCVWSGVTCKGASISALDLSGNGLSGPFSESIFALSDLERLNLSSNTLSGPLPDKFLSLPALKNLALDSNNFTGNIPSSLASHPVLATIHLSHNQFVGPVSFSSSSLATLMIDHNSLESLVVTDNTRFVRFAANDNAFTGDLPDFSFSTSLQIFNSSWKLLIVTFGSLPSTGSIFDLTRLTNLTWFDVRNNMLSGPFPADVSSLSHLTNFILSSNALSGDFPSTMAPASLTTCAVLPNNVQVLPPDTVLADQNSLASKCGMRSPSWSKNDAVSTGTLEQSYAAVSPGEGWLDRTGAGGGGGSSSDPDSSSTVLSNAGDRSMIKVSYVATLAAGVVAFNWMVTQPWG
ncbi:hypothetical protein BS47DRAFT_1388944 [Hydnum rufescens UP504]|uniref:Leucine-rich repeat-containing N-terminal plant-type domain-containing protein n=1 Tax=Hydnum rufescens UP504 TaxID=1448309 RepID=A0A9P6B6X7_9AGAM|nr:hypothetical protein BS47DRAFT_1388944 [Hydnum rufescens UP504]